MSKLALVAIIVAAGLTGGCASVSSLAGTHYQSLSVKTLGQNQEELAGASCELTTQNGKWFLTTPGSVMIPRSNEDMQVVCKKTGHEPGRAAVVSKIKATMFGNILAGGPIGAVVDYHNGSAYDYPELIQITMGTFTKAELRRGLNLSTRQSEAVTATTSPGNDPSMQPMDRHASYAFLPTGIVISEPPTTSPDSKSKPEPAISPLSLLKKTRGDICDSHVLEGEYCWWSPPGNYNLCPLSATLKECNAAYGKGCQLGHGKVVPMC